MACKLLRTLLDNHTCHLVAAHLTQDLFISNGVTQGSLLSSTLFNLHILYTPSTPPIHILYTNLYTPPTSANFNIVSSADGLTISTTHNDIPTATIHLHNYQIHSRPCWFITNRLKVTPTTSIITLLTLSQKKYQHLW